VLLWCRIKISRVARCCWRKWRVYHWCY